MKKFFALILIVLVSLGGLAQAAPPPVKVGLVPMPADDAVYGPGDSINLILSLINKGGELITAKGFQSSPFHLFLSFTDPDGKTIQATYWTGAHTEIDPPPPPRMVEIGSLYQQIEPVERMIADWAITLNPFNARAFYPLTLGGPYCVKAQVPMKTYAPGSADNYLQDGQLYAPVSAINASGLLESKPYCFNLQEPVNIDLEVSQVAPDTLPKGNNLVYTLTVFNKGPDTAKEVILTDTWTNGTFVSLDAKGYDCSQTGNTVTCKLGKLAKDQVVSLGLTVLPTGDVSNTLSVSGQGTEAVVVPTNNSSTKTTSVIVGTPRISGSIGSKGRNPDNSYFVDLILTNNGTGNARNIRINKTEFKVLIGSGSISRISPSLPIIIEALDVTAVTVRRLTLNLDGSVTRFSMTESGTVQDLSTPSPKTYNFSISQAVMP
jgi:uncharacterized repeat protein (TIGR01451 family)